MTKYRPYSRESASVRTGGSTEPEAMSLITGGMAALIVVVTLVLAPSLPSTAFTWWFLGALQTALVAVYFDLVHAAFLAHDGEAIWHLRGAWSEDNTRSELQRAKRKGLIWGGSTASAFKPATSNDFVVTRKPRR